MSPIIFCTKAHASTVLGANALSFVTLRQLSARTCLPGSIQLFVAGERRAAS
jgi:hypothetical protein